MIDTWLEPPCEKPFLCKCLDRDCEGCGFEEDFYDSYDKYLDGLTDTQDVGHLRMEKYIVQQLQLRSN